MGRGSGARRVTAVGEGSVAVLDGALRGRSDRAGAGASFDSSIARCSSSVPPIALGLHSWRRLWLFSRHPARLVPAVGSLSEVPSWRLAITRPSCGTFLARTPPSSYPIPTPYYYSLNGKHVMVSQDHRGHPADTSVGKGLGNTTKSEVDVR